MPSRADLIYLLVDAFPHSTVRPETVAVYGERLKDIGLPVLEAAVERLLDTVDHFPTLARIRAVAAEISLSLPSEDQALAQIEGRLAWAREDEGSRGPQPAVHEAVREALGHVGGFYAIKSAEEPTVVRGQFLRLYRELRARLLFEAQVRRPPALNNGRPEVPVS